jgi:hypothetical protein
VARRAGRARGLVWLACRAVFAFLGLPALDGPRSGGCRWRPLLLAAACSSACCSPSWYALVGWPRAAPGTGRAPAAAAIADVAATHIVAPVQEVLRSYDDAREPSPPPPTGLGPAPAGFARSGWSTCLGRLGVAAPAHFFATFPGFGLHWTAAYPPYNQHLIVIWAPRC